MCEGINREINYANLLHPLTVGGSVSASLSSWKSKSLLAWLPGRPWKIAFIAVTGSAILRFVSECHPAGPFQWIFNQPDVSLRIKRILFYYLMLPRIHFRRIKRNTFCHLFSKICCYISGTFYNISVKRFHLSHWLSRLFPFPYLDH